MPKRNYQFEKRQKDLAKKQKKEEKRLRKLDRPKSAPEDSLASDTLSGTADSQVLLEEHDRTPS